MMQNYNICVLGYNHNYKKFLNHLKDNRTKYNLKIFDKSNNINKLDGPKVCKDIVKKKIKFLAICDQKFIPFVSNYVEFMIKNKIKIVQASNNFEVENHGFIIEKPFKDYSFEELFLRKTLKLNLKKTEKFLRNKKILITGGAGSIGSGIVRKLLGFNVKKIIVLDISEYNIFKLKNSINKFKNFSKVDFVLTNIENFDLLINDFKNYKPDVIFNAAALKHVSFLEKNSKQGFLTNVLGTENVLKASKINSVKYFIHISTDKAADPKNVLGYTKLISEFVVKSFKDKKMAIGTVRFGNVFNSYGSVAETFKDKIFNFDKIKLSHPSVERFFMSLDEATNLIINSLNLLTYKKKNIQNKTFICDMGKPIKIKDLAHKILYLCGRDPKKNISKNYYGLNLNNEKLTERLISKKEKIVNSGNKLIFEILGNYKYFDQKKINKLIREKTTNNEFKKILKKICQ
tara:strand:+ start:956 stop:2332 length:1377 start_codon:yes stop_codon:yes gene_type:complete